jgi:hypothetical protein
VRTSAGASVAVLPFVNLSRAKDDEYFSDGITEEVINALANVEGVRVVSRTSAFAYKGKNLSVRKIGEELLHEWSTARASRGRAGAVDRRRAAASERRHTRRSSWTVASPRRTPRSG